MEYYGIYGSNNDYRNYLMHYGRKGMLWGKHIFGDDTNADNALAWKRARQRSTDDINWAKSRIGNYARKTKSNFGKIGKGGGLKAIGATAKNAVTTAGMAVQYGALVAERAVADALHAGAQVFHKAKKGVIAFGKKAISGIKNLFGKGLSFVKEKGAAAWNKGKDLISKGASAVSGAAKKVGSTVAGAASKVGGAISNVAKSIHNNNPLTVKDQRNKRGEVHRQEMEATERQRNSSAGLTGSKNINDPKNKVLASGQPFSLGPGVGHVPTSYTAYLSNAKGPKSGKAANPLARRGVDTSSITEEARSVASRNSEANKSIVSRNSKKKKKKKQTSADIARAANNGTLGRNWNF